MRLIRAGLLIKILCAMLPLVFSLALFFGTEYISPFDLLARNTDSQDWLIIQRIRLPRVILAALIGLNLALCGAVLQGLFRNALADPTLIGVSAGASLGASIAIVFGSVWLATGISSSAIWGFSLISISAVIGGLLAALLVYRLASGVEGTSVATMLLAGIAISSLAAAMNSLLSFFADNNMLRKISLWQMGALDHASWFKVIVSLFISVLLLVWLPKKAAALNAMLLGESEARHLGVDVQAIKRELIFLCALGVGIAVSVAGIIGFVGLMVPHLVRVLIGPDHRFLLAASALLGALLLMVADIVARVIVAPAELPVGVVTAILGAPFFIYLLVQQRHKLIL